MSDTHEVRGVRGKPFSPGHDPRRGKNGGRSERLAEIQRMLDDEHRTADNIRSIFAELRRLAIEDTVSTWTDERGNEHEQRRPPMPAFMEMYLNRVLGPVKALISEEDLEDAPDVVIEWLRRLN